MGPEGGRGRLTVGEVSERTGVTVRTLHHYDEIGLLRPAGRTGSGYRLYDDEALGRLYRILALQEMGLTLGEVGELLDGDPAEAGELLARKATNLEEEVARRRLRFDRLERLLRAARMTEGVVPPERLMEGLEEVERLRPHYAADDLRAMEAAHREAPSERQRRATVEWFELYAALAEDLEAGRSPEEPEVRERAFRFEELFLVFHSGDAGAPARHRAAFAQGGPVMRYVARALASGPVRERERAGSGSAPPVRLDVPVHAPVETAFRAFTERMERWWPAAYTWSGTALELMGIEPWVGGRCFEEGGGGTHLDWGRVRECSAPERLVLSWHIAFDRTPEPDPGRSSEVEVVFEPVDADTCRLRLEHRHFRRHGEGAEAYRAALASPEGWPFIVRCFRDAVVGGDRDGGGSHRGR